MNHKPRKRTVIEVGSGWTDRKVKGIPRLTRIWIQYFEEEGRHPFFVLIPQDGKTIRVKDTRGFFTFDNGMEGWEYMNRKTIARSKKK